MFSSGDTCKYNFSHSLNVPPFFPSAKKYVDVLNPTGQSSANGPVMLPNSLLPTFPGPTAAINPASLFVPTPVTGMKDLLLTFPVF